MKREKVIEFIQDSLISTERTAEILDVSKTRLNKIKELNVIVRGYYLKTDVLDYLNSEDIKLRRAKYQKKGVGKDE